jgi:hypothetical protein
MKVGIVVVAVATLGSSRQRKQDTERDPASSGGYGYAVVERYTGEAYSLQPSMNEFLGQSYGVPFLLSC